MTKKTKLSQTEIAKRTGRSRQAVSSLLKRGVSEEKILQEPPGSRLAEPETFGRPGQFSGEGSIALWAEKLGITYGRLRYRAIQLDSLLKAVKSFRPDLGPLRKLDPELKVPEADSGAAKGVKTRRGGSKTAKVVS